MRLLSLSQLNYRNLRTPQLEFSAGINALIGANAAGKSNVLEAITLACSGDLSATPIQQLLNHQASEAFVRLRLEHSDGHSTISVGLTTGRKRLQLDGQTVRALDIARVAAAVRISPEDADLVHGAPARRRHYLDSLLSRLSMRYALLLREYLRVLEQRNALLKQASSDASSAIWDTKFLELANAIHDLRRRALLRIDALAQASYRDIAGGDKTLQVRLLNHDQDITQALQQSKAQERLRGMTLVGPHREDVLLELAGRSVQAFGSRGEARTTALALRIAEYQLLLERHGEAPLLLIDDVNAELDSQRRHYLLELAASTPQALVTGTEALPQAQHALNIADGYITNVTASTPTAAEKARNGQQA